ncbi:MAG: YggS family pyridoxal phosphate-dependent enzyme [Ruminococcus sp.]|nr:YggS family pyridoxal phosphate-dependent enzyme [Ruminococcus sp.]MBR6385096.1 YggS family pyridoxal phosphate-dependent enzyme [Ruminococcus sp.]
MANEFGYIDENLKVIREKVGEASEKSGHKVAIMAVTKTVPAQAVNHAVKLGVRLLGENRVQEFLTKQSSYDNSAKVHMIGHLQTNKVKYIINSVDMIQSVDSLKLGQEINRLALANGKVMDILCEVNIGGEESKSGVAPEKLRELVVQLSQLKSIRIRGIMTVPPPVDSDIFLGRTEELYNKIKYAHISGVDMDILSMGMSNDYEKAIMYGSNLVRIGTALFGARNYQK